MDAFIDEVVKIIGAALGTALIGLLVQLARKYGFDISAAKHAQLESVAQQAILMVEEKAAAAVKAQVGKVNPAEKLNAAVSIVLERMPGVSREEAADIIHAKLPEVRAATASFATAVLQNATNRDGQ